MKRLNWVSPIRQGVSVPLGVVTSFVILALLCCGVLTQAIARSPVAGPSLAEASTAVQKTKVKKVSPLNRKGKVRKGLQVRPDTAGGGCTGGSHAIGAAFRCVDSGESALYDPCWYSHDETMMFCWGSPWDRKVTRFFPYIESDLDNRPVNRTHPWGITLSGGERCSLILGSTSAVDGVAVRWTCSKRLGLLDDLNRSGRVWSLSAVTYDNSTSTLTHAGTREVAIAWFGRRSRNP